MPHAFDFTIKALIEIVFFFHILIVLEFLPLRNSLYRERHVSHNALVFSCSIGNKRQQLLLRDC